jgi:hypothetical protein
MKLEELRKRPHLHHLGRVEEHLKINPMQIEEILEEYAKFALSPLELAYETGYSSWKGEEDGKSRAYYH